MNPFPNAATLVRRMLAAVVLAAGGAQAQPAAPAVMAGAAAPAASAAERHPVPGLRTVVRQPVDASAPPPRRLTEQERQELRDLLRRHTRHAAAKP